jgi:hypothetical protein
MMDADGHLDLATALGNGVSDTESAWRFIRLFAAHYAGPITAGDGVSESELVAAEERLGFLLPRTLRDLHLMLGRRKDLTQKQDSLLTPPEIDVDETGQVLVFRVENQGVARWGIPLSDLINPDPLVLMRTEVGLGRSSWQPFLDRFSLAALEMVLSEWFAPDEEFFDQCEADARTISALKQRFRRLPLPAYRLWASPDEGFISWFAAPDGLLLLLPDGWLGVRGISEEAFDAVRRVLPGEWASVG